MKGTFAARAATRDAKRLGGENVGGGIINCKKILTCTEILP